MTPEGRYRWALRSSARYCAHGDVNSQIGGSANSLARVPLRTRPTDRFRVMGHTEINEVSRRGLAVRGRAMCRIIPYGYRGKVLSCAGARCDNASAQAEGVSRREL